MAQAQTISEAEIAWRGAVMNGRVLIALIFREAALRFGAGPIAYAWTMIEPAVMIGLVLLMRIYVKNYAPAFGENSTLFLLTGLVAFRITRSTINRAGKAISSNQTLFSFGAVKPPDVVFARTVVEYTIWMIVLAAFFFGCGHLLGQTMITDFQEFVLTLGAIFYFCLSLGMFNATFGALIQVWRTIWKIMTLPLLVLSGVIYVPSSMPPEVQAVIVWNPFLHCIEGMRSSSYLDYLSLYNPYYLVGFSTVVLLVSLAVERLFRKEIIRARGDEDEEDEMI